MDGGSSSTDARLADLERAVRALQSRVDAIAPLPAAIESAMNAGAQTSDFQLQTSVDPIALLTLVGRSLVVIGGAYLLRALTEAGVLSTPAGVSLGFVYALVWLAAADRVGAAGRPLSAVFYGATTTIIALPLLFESMTRFAVIGGAEGGAVLTAVSVAVLAVAVRARLQALAWIIVCGAATASIALSAATGFVLPLAIADIVLGIVTLWIGYTVDWIWLRWLPAIVADIAVLALAMGASMPAPLAPAPYVVATQLLLFGAYLASISIRTLVREREVNVFETVQGAAALAVGFGGAVYVARVTGSIAGLLDGVGLVCAIGAYAVAFAFVARRQGLHRNFYFYTSIALVLVLAATATSQPQGALLWAGFAVLTSWTAARTGHFALSLHAAIYFAAAAIGSGLVAVATIALLGTPAPVSVSALLVAIFAAGCASWVAPPATGESRTWARLPRTAMPLILGWSAAAAIVVIAGSWSNDPGFIATVRTGALAVAALALAGIGRVPRLGEARWLVYPLLVTGGMKLVLEDLPRSRPATLFIALAMYGVALIAAPRLTARGAPL